MSLDIYNIIMSCLSNVNEWNKGGNGRPIQGRGNENPGSDLQSIINNMPSKEKVKAGRIVEGINIPGVNRNPAVKNKKFEGYYESLKTLHKSGLLTTKEMNELLEKHKKDI